MVILVQRVSQAELKIYEDNKFKFIGNIGIGLVVYVGFGNEEPEINYEKVSEKILNLRIFEDNQGKMNLSVRDINGGVMLVPNFTLLADAKKGNRPSFDKAMPPNAARELFAKLCQTLNANHMKVVCGIFGADMRINQQNLGPINILI